MSTPKKPEYRHIGKYRPRKDAREIVTGKCIYLDDFKMKDMLHAKLMPSPYAHAMIKDIDTSKAEALPGVYAVVTYKNQPEFSKEFLQGLPPVKKVCDQHLRYVGDCVALVAAESEELCEEAIRLIKVDYEVLPAVFDIEQAKADGAAQLYPGFFENNRYEKDLGFGDEKMLFAVERGDCDKACEEADYVYEGTGYFETNPAPLAPEPPEMIMYYDDINNKYLMWATAQSDRVPKMPPDVGRMPADSVIESRVFNVGGSYGNKQSQVAIVSSAAVLSMKTGRPVKFYQTKAEQMCCFETRLGSQVHAKIGMDADGVVRAVKAEWTVDTGCLSNATQGQIGVGIGEAQLVMCKCPNWGLDTNLVVTNKQPAGIVRGYGGQELNSCLSLLIGRTMRAGGFDPVECYKKNYVGEGDVYTWRDGRQWQAHSVNYVKAIEASAEKFGWKDKWKGWGVPTWESEDGRFVRGVGCGIIGNADIGEDNIEAYVRVVPDLIGDKAHIVLQTNITESGMGQRSNIVKMVAEVMNVPYERVEITPGDTMINPTGFGLCGSRGTITYGHAVSSAAEDAKHKLFELAKPYLEVAEDSMYLTEYGVATVARPGKFVTWKKLIPQDLPLTGYGQHLENFSTPNMFIVFLEVQVDRETGKVDVLNMLGGTDCGQMIDPSGLEMQAQGGIGSASLDAATFEEHIIDPGTGRTMTYDMIEYKWRPFNEFPKYETCFMESQFDTFQFKATGVGEIAGAAAASATMQAISNAIGVQVATYPATPDVILKALGKI